MVRKEPKVCGVADKNYPEGLKRIRKNEKEFCSLIDIIYYVMKIYGSNYAHYAHSFQSTRMNFCLRRHRNNQEWTGIYHKYL